MRAYVVIGLLCLAAAVRAQDYSAQIAQADAYLSQLANERVVGGIIAVQKDGELVWSNGYGYAVEVRMRAATDCCRWVMLRLKTTRIWKVPDDDHALPPALHVGHTPLRILAH